MVFKCIEEARKRISPKYSDKESYFEEMESWDYIKDSNNEEHMELFKEALGIVFNAYSGYISEDAMNRLRNLDIAFVNEEQMKEKFNTVSFGVYRRDEENDVPLPKIGVLNTRSKDKMLHTTVHELIHVITKHPFPSGLQIGGNFNEGVTNFLTYKALFEAGKINRLSYQTFLNGDSYQHHTLLISKLGKIVGNEATELELFAGAGLTKKVFKEAYGDEKVNGSRGQEDARSLYDNFDSLDLDEVANYKIEDLFHNLTREIKNLEIKKAMEKMGNCILGKAPMKNIWDYIESTVDVKQACGDIFSDVLVEESTLMDDVLKETDIHMIKKIERDSGDYTVGHMYPNVFSSLRKYYEENGKKDIKRCNIYSHGYKQYQELLRIEDLQSILVLEGEENDKVMAIVQPRYNEDGVSTKIFELNPEQTELFKTALSEGISLRGIYGKTEITPEKLKENVIEINPNKNIEAILRGEGNNIVNPKKQNKGDVTKDKGGTQIAADR